jgi:hypothetical protein
MVPNKPLNLQIEVHFFFFYYFCPYVAFFIITNVYLETDLPTVEAFQRHELTLLRMEDILRNGMMPTNDNGNHLKAQQLCEDLVDFATRLTTAKRRLLEDLELYVDQDGKALDLEEQKIRRRKICERLALIPGKLDHATCVAYEARIQPPNPITNTEMDALTHQMVASYPFRESSI